MANILIAYYSRKGQNYWNGSIKNIAKGNTEIVAEMIQETVGGELFEIDTVNPYPIDYYECIDVAKQELRDKSRPEITDIVENMNDYDVIFLGYPNWWGTMPMSVFTFLESYDLSGKTIIPFCTNEGSGMGVSENDIKQYSDANVKKGLSIHGAEASKSKKAVEKWAKSSL
ncbi:MAG: flavodoxin [Clostridium perfringens]|nr:flavodoxin [Clostridium perfringens]